MPGGLDTAAAVSNGQPPKPCCEEVSPTCTAKKLGGAD